MVRPYVLRLTASATGFGWRFETKVPADLAKKTTDKETAILDGKFNVPVIDSEPKSSM